jgi:hypothetical protein
VVYLDRQGRGNWLIYVCLVAGLVYCLSLEFFYRHY